MPVFAPRERRNEEMSDTRVGFRAAGKELPAKPAFPNHAGTPIGKTRSRAFGSRAAIR
jgi:hypothetical protein